MFLLVPTSPGEVLDKISILEVKMVCFKDEAKKAQAQKELVLLLSHKHELLGKDPELMDLYLNLRLRNRWLFDTEDAIRESTRKFRDRKPVDEKKGDYLFECYRLIELIHKYNKERAQYKAEINRLLGSSISEAKKYASQEG